MKKITASVAALALLMSQPAHADNGCNGCSVVDANEFNSYLVGTTVYLEGSRAGRVTVQSLSYSTGQAYVLFPEGDHGWVYASNLYTSASHDERVATGVIGTAAAAALLYCIFGGCSGNNGNSNSRSYSNSNNNNYHSPPPPPPYVYHPPAYSPPSPPPPPPPCTTGLHGNCHGGHLYSHPEH